MTDGQKWEIFVLQLSFLGWILLGSLLCGIGLFFVEPYVQATYAELYAKLRDRARCPRASPPWRSSPAPCRRPDAMAAPAQSLRRGAFLPAPDLS